MGALELCLCWESGRFVFGQGYSNDRKVQDCSWDYGRDPVGAGIRHRCMWVSPACCDGGEVEELCSVLTNSMPWFWEVSWQLGFLQEVSCGRRSLSQAWYSTLGVVLAETV